MEQIKILFDLIKNNKYDEFIKILNKEKALDINFRDENGNYLITYAIIKNNIELLKLILDKECRIDITDQEGRSVLYLPIKYAYNEIIDLLINYDKTNVGVSIIDMKDKFNNIPLHYAIFFKNLSAIDSLIKVNSNTNIGDENGNNSLHLAIYSKKTEICKKILETDININSKTSIGETALHIACNFKLFDVVKMLVEAGIDVNIQDYNNEITALMYSINLNDNVSSKYLLNNYADPNIQDFMGNTSIHYSIIEENYEILNELVNSKTIKIHSNLNIYNINGQLPLHLLLDKESFYENEIMFEIVSKSNLNFQNEEGNTPLHIICKKGLWKIYSKIMKTKKLNIFIKNHGGQMPVDYINKNDINDFMNIVIDSYLYILRNRNFIWKEDWENLCNKELFYDKLTKDEIEIINKYIKSSDKNYKGEICFKLVNDKLKDIYNNKSAKCNYSSYPQKKSSKCIKLDPISKVEMCSFTGITLDILIGLIYLLKNYDYACSTITRNFINNTDLCNYFSNIGIKTNTQCEFLNFEIVWIYKKLFFSENFAENFNKCINNTKVRFVIIPLGIELKKGSHANYLIFDKKTYELERFEPYGSSSPYRFNYDSKLLDNILAFKFIEINENIKLISPDKFLPKIGFQYFDVYESKTKKIGDPGGFCALWSLWYTEMRLKYPDVDRKALVNKLLKEIKMSGVSFKNLIRNYSINITKIRDDIFDKSGITINDWLNDQYSESQYLEIIENITQLLSKHTM
jgi:ankyrin repeat protein